MLSLSAAAAAMVASGTYTYRVRVLSYYDDMLVDDDVPVVAGSCTETVDRSDTVPERLTFNVPRLVRGVDYTPTNLRDPLAANGQQLQVQLGIGLGRTDQIEWVQRRWFTVYESELQGDVVAVEARGLLWPISEARLVSPYQPSGTLVSALRGLIEPELTVLIDGNLTDRPVPAAINTDDDRLGAVGQILAAWPAEGHVTEDGYYYVYPSADPTTVALALTDGVGGTVIRASGKSTRDGVYNAVVARGTTADGANVQGVGFASGPKAYGTPFNQLPVPFFFESPLITTQAQAQAAAITRMQTLQRTTFQTYTVEMVPHPALQEGDLVSLTTDELAAVPAVVEALALPCGAGGGTETLTVRRLS